METIIFAFTAIFGVIIVYYSYLFGLNGYGVRDVLASFKKVFRKSKIAIRPKIERSSIKIIDNIIAILKDSHMTYELKSNYNILVSIKNNYSLNPEIHAPLIVKYEPTFHVIHTTYMELEKKHMITDKHINNEIYDILKSYVQKDLNNIRKLASKNSELELEFNIKSLANSLESERKTLDKLELLNQPLQPIEIGIVKSKPHSSVQ